MRQFAQKGFRIEKLSLEAKILYSAFLLFSFAALLVSVLYYYDLVGERSFAGAREYYGGEVGSQHIAPTADDTGNGPELDFPDDMEEIAPANTPMLLSMTRRKLLEVTHFHLFTLPVFLLIIAHLFMLCSMRPATKVTWMVSSIASSAVHIAAPWLVFWGGPSWAWMMPVTGAWMTVSMVVLMGWPGITMWRRD